MKHLTLIIFLLAMTSNLNAQQNHVPNCSFEQYTQCPTSSGHTIFIVGWKPYTHGTSDYYHTCGTGFANVPIAGPGYQPPAHGKAYTGGYTYVQGNSSQIKEYVYTQITPLMAGSRYEVSMSASLGNGCKYGTNDLGVFFLRDGPIFFQSVARSRLLRKFLTVVMAR